jgi:hypothetical protein
MLAEVWKTSRGLLFVSKLPGAHSDASNDPDDPFAPPTAVLSKHERIRRVRGQSKKPSGPGWQPAPITVVRILLDGPINAQLWVKCARHGPAVVDRLGLNRVYELDQAARRERDTLMPRVIRLNDVGALSSSQ